VFSDQAEEDGRVVRGGEDLSGRLKARSLVVAVQLKCSTAVVKLRLDLVP